MYDPHRSLNILYSALILYTDRIDNVLDLRLLNYHLLRQIYIVKSLLCPLQVSRSIGDAYMKHAQFNREPINPKFRIPEPINKPILTADPSIVSYPLQPSDSFVIFASDGLWEHLSNEQAVEIVHNHPRAVRLKSLLLCLSRIFIIFEFSLLL